MDERRIIVKPYEMISILEYDGNQQVNEHGIVKISGIIKKDKREEYINKAEKEPLVQIAALNEDDTETNIFRGILEKMEIRIKGDVCWMEIEICTGTKWLDNTYHTRSFQKMDCTYEEVVKCCNQNYSHAGVIITTGRKTFIPGFVMQYGETDWGFLKRMAGCLNTVLVPSCKTNSANYFFGIPEKRKKVILDSDSYTIRREQEGKRRNITYIVENRDICELGDRVEFQGKDCWIWKIKTGLKGNELYNTYYLREKNGMKGSRIYNQNLIGLSLSGEITAVEEERVKIKIRGDENPQCGSRWFPFSTVYSSAEGAGWYCMPETGDKIRLYFPTEDEKEAYVSSAFHENQGNGIRVNPAHKVWRNKEGKEIRMTPDNILITNNKGMSVELSDQTGISIHSNGSVDITAEQMIGISSYEADLELNAANRITFKQGDTVMEMEDGIQLSGGKINMQ